MKSKCMPIFRTIPKTMKSVCKDPLACSVEKAKKRDTYSRPRY